MSDRLAATLRRAIGRRASLARRPETTAYRLVNGAADGLPGVVVDRYGDVAVLGLEDDRLEPGEFVAELPRALPDLESVYVKRHPRQASRLSEEERAWRAPAAPDWGAPVDALIARENGVALEIRPGDGLSVGLFPDMRDVRAWVCGQSGGRRVLNLFAYTCAFGLNASLGGASRVVNLDLSRAYLGWGQRNYRHNGLEPEPRDFVYGDAFDWLARFARREERFDLVLVDPPSFSTTRESRFAVERDLARLVATSAGVVAPRGILLVATNHARLPASRFSTLVRDGLGAVGRTARPIQSWHEPAPDFPIVTGGEPYLKVLALALDEPRSLRRSSARHVPARGPDPSNSPQRGNDR